MSTAEEVGATFHGGIGLALMASELATLRTENESGNCQIRLGESSGPVLRERVTAFHRWYPASLEYYQIIDRISQYRKP